MIDSKKQRSNKIIMGKVRKLCEMHNTSILDTNAMADSKIDLWDMNTKYVNGERCLSFDKILDICNEFEIKFDDLLML